MLKPEILNGLPMLLMVREEIAADPHCVVGDPERPAKEIEEESDQVRIRIRQSKCIPRLFTFGPIQGAKNGKVII